MLSYTHVAGFTHKTFDKTKVKPKKMATDFTNITNDVKNLVGAINQYASDWGQVSTKISSSDWAEYADGVGTTAENIASSLSNAASNLMMDLNELVETMSGFSNKEAQQLDSAKTTMNNSLDTLQRLGGSK